VCVSLGNLHGANNPNDGRNLDSSLTAEPIGDERRGKSSDEGSSGHSAYYSTLTYATVHVEVVGVGLGAKDPGHGGDIETEETSACSDV